MNLDSGCLRSRKTIFRSLLFLLVLSGVPAASANSGGSSSDTLSVAVVSDTGMTRSKLALAVADSPRERYVGLSKTESLADTEGMLFVYDSADTRVFVMREMSFPLDILYFDRHGRLTRIHGATTDDGLREYRGRARWVLEVNRGWARRHNVELGDRLVAPRLDLE